MSYLNNSDKFEKYYHENYSSLIYPTFIEGIDNIYPEKRDANDYFLFDNNNIFFNQDNDETESYIQLQLNDEKNFQYKNSYESNKNPSTNAITTKIREGPIFKISKTLKNIDNTKNANNSNNTKIGKKRKNYKNGKHDKFCYDNLTRKVKSKLFEAILNILNSFKYKIFFFLKIKQNFILNIKQNLIEIY